MVDQSDEAAFCHALNNLSWLLTIDDGSVDAHPVAASRLETELLRYCLEGPTADVFKLIQSPGFRDWARDKRRVTDPGDDHETQLGISWLWAKPETHPMTPAGWLHDLWYRDSFSRNSGFRRRRCDIRFLQLCNMFAEMAPEDERTYRFAEAHGFFRLVRLFGGALYKGRP